MLTATKPAATAKVICVPRTSPSGEASATSAAPETLANRVPSAEAAMMEPKLRARLSMPETTPRWSCSAPDMMAVLLATTNMM